MPPRLRGDILARADELPRLAPTKRSSEGAAQLGGSDGPVEVEGSAARRCPWRRDRPHPASGPSFERGVRVRRVGSCHSCGKMSHWPGKSTFPRRTAVSKGEESPQPKGKMVYHAREISSFGQSARIHPVGAPHSHGKMVCSPGMRSFSRRNAVVHSVPTPSSRGEMGLPPSKTTFSRRSTPISRRK